MRKIVKYFHRPGRHCGSSALRDSDGISRIQPHRTYVFWNCSGRGNKEISKKTKPSCEQVHLLSEIRELEYNYHSQIVWLFE